MKERIDSSFRDHPRNDESTLLNVTAMRCIVHSLKGDVRIPRRKGMSSQTVTLHLPDALYRELQQRAAQTCRTVEDESFVGRKREMCWWAERRSVGLR